MSNVSAADLKIAAAALCSKGFAAGTFAEELLAPVPVRLGVLATYRSASTAWRHRLELVAALSYGAVSSRMVTLLARCCRASKFVDAEAMLDVFDLGCNSVPLPWVDGRMLACMHRALNSRDKYYEPAFSTLAHAAGLFLANGWRPNDNNKEMRRIADRLEGLLRYGRASFDFAAGPSGLAELLRHWGRKAHPNAELAQLPYELNRRTVREWAQATYGAGQGRHGIRPRVAVEPRRARTLVLGWATLAHDARSTLTLSFEHDGRPASAELRWRAAERVGMQLLATEDVLGLTNCVDQKAGWRR